MMVAPSRILAANRTPKPQYVKYFQCSRVNINTNEVVQAELPVSENILFSMPEGR